MRHKIRSFLRKEIDLKHIPGAVLQVSHKGKILFREAMGDRIVYPEKSAMALDTVFDLASLTKVVATTPAILKLIDEGAIRLDDEVAYFLPTFAGNGKQDVTIRHLMTHTSGLPAHRPFHSDRLTETEVMDKIYTERLEHAAGTKVVYSDLGFITLYKIIETVTDTPFSDFVNEAIFRPLEMKETGFLPTFPEHRYAVTEYSERLQNYKCGVVHDENTQSMGGISGHAGLFSTIYDLHNYASMIENNGVYNGKRILSEAVLNASRQNHTPLERECRGLGWMIKSPERASCGDLFSGQSYGHTGFTGTSIWFDPAIDLHVVLLTNRVHFGREPYIIRLRPRLHNLIRSLV